VHDSYISSLSSSGSKWGFFFSSLALVVLLELVFFDLGFRSPLLFPLRGCTISFPRFTNPPNSVLIHLSLSSLYFLSRLSLRFQCHVVLPMFVSVVLTPLFPPFSFVQESATQHKYIKREESIHAPPLS